MPLSRPRRRDNGRFGDGRFGNRWLRDTGASAVEMSIVAPALLLLIFTAIQVALWLYGRGVAEQSAREGVSFLRVVAPGATASSALAAAQVTAVNYASQVGRETVAGATATATVLGERRVRIEVTGRAVSLVPGLELPVRGSAEGQIEQFEVDR